MIGKKKRMSRLFNSRSKNIVLTPLDHGITIGPVKGLNRMDETIPRLVSSGADSLVLHKGLINHYGEYLTGGETGLMMHLSASTDFSPHANHKVITGSVKDAITAGCDGVSVHLNLGDEKEPEMIRDVACISSECTAAGMPLLIMIYIKEKEITPESVAHSVRVALELGADMIKINYTGEKESFRELIRSCPVPVLVAGGQKTEDPEELYIMIQEAMEAGARGVAIGRNVFQNDEMEDVLEKISNIVHSTSLITL